MYFYLYINYSLLVLCVYMVYRNGYNSFYWKMFYFMIKDLYSDNYELLKVFKIYIIMIRLINEYWLKLEFE